MTATALTIEALGEVTAAFGLGPLLESERLEAGTINSNYRVETASGRFFLRINEGKQDADVDYEVALVDAIAAAGVPTPVPLTTTDGRRYVHREGKQVSVFPWLEGSHRQGAELEVAHLAALGAALANLHDATAALSPSFHRAGIYSTADIARRCQGIDAAGDVELGVALEVAGRELDELRGQGPAREAQAGCVIHGDLFPDNVLFAGDAITALLDFEQASSGKPLYDLAVCLNAWCHDGRTLAEPLARALLSSYQDVRPLEALGAEALWIECRAAAVRFMVTRITDVHLVGLTRAGKDYRAYWRRLESWRAGGVSAIEALL